MPYAREYNGAYHALEKTTVHIMSTRKQLYSINGGACDVLGKTMVRGIMMSMVHKCMLHYVHKRCILCAHCWTTRLLRSVSQLCKCRRHANESSFNDVACCVMFNQTITFSISFMSRCCVLFPWRCCKRILHSKCPRHHSRLAWNRSIKNKPSVAHLY